MKPAAKAHVMVEARAGGDLLAAPNSWAALVASHVAGADLIEIDVRRSSDGVFYLRRADELPDGRRGAQLTRSELDRVLVDGAPIAWLDDVLAWAHGEQVRLVLDVKPSTRADAEVVLAAVGETVHAAGAAGVVTVASYDHAALAALRDRIGVRTRPLLRGRPLDLAAVLAAARGDEVALFFGETSHGDAETARSIGLATVLVGLRDLDVARALDLGVDAVSWGDPGAARAALDALPPQPPATRGTLSLPRLPLLADKHYGEPSVFRPDALLGQARRQRGLPDGPVPRVCLLDPDGDIARHLRANRRSKPLETWACYHTELDVFDLDGRETGVVGCAVGAPFAVLVAEELHASGCELVVSVTSAGRVGADGHGGFMLIDRALRDEGTSHHYLRPGAEARLAPAIAAALAGALDDLPVHCFAGDSWTTDAPFRETQRALDRHAASGIACVEMEAAALYAYAQVSGACVVCVAHLTNEMGRTEIDFEKGSNDGADDALAVVGRIAGRLLAR